MARPKKNEAEMTTRSFKLTAELDAALKDVSAACGKTVTDVLVGLVEELVAANRAGIVNYRRRQSNFKIKATFAVSATPKPARTTAKKKKNPAQVVATSGDVKAGDDNAEN